MRFALVSDIHANLQAWESTLLDIRSLKIDQIICLGDMVGYGPCPAQVLESVHANVHHFVLGNHDAVVCHKLDDRLFNDTAQEIIRWTRGRLNRNAVRFLRALPLSLMGDGYRCSHGDLAEPAAFNYVVEPQDALASWKAVDEPLLFIGHTHEPKLFLVGRSGTPHGVSPQDFQLEPEKRYIVNVGSVGQPRDADARASYCVYDTGTKSIFFRRIPFDLDAYRRDVEAARIPIEGSYFLKHDPRQGVPPLREMFSFSPPTSPELLTKDAKPVEAIRILRRQAGRWRLLAILLALVSVLSAVWFHRLWSNREVKGFDIRDPAMADVLAAEAGPGQNLLKPFDTATRVGTPLPGWSVHLGNWKHQMFSLAKPGEMPASLVLTSSAKDEIWIGGPVIRVQPGMKLTGAMRVFAEELEGDIALYLVVRRERDGRPVSDVHTANPGRKRRDGWMSAQKTITIPANATELQYEVHGRFCGKVLLTDLTLQVKVPGSTGDSAVVESPAESPPSTTHP